MSAALQHRRRLLAAGALVLTLAGCSSAAGKDSPADSNSVPSGSSDATTPTSSSPAPHLTKGSPPPGGGQYYVSLGDSYASGYQPDGPGAPGTTKAGFAYQIVGDAKAKGYDFTLVNFACSGATTSSILSSVGCEAAFRGPGAPAYDSQTQAAAAEAFLAAHAGHIGLITISIGGNDIVPCGTAVNPDSCLAAAGKKITDNLTALLSGIRAVAPGVPIVGSTYPDVFLGNLLSDDGAVRNIGLISVTAFRGILNPRLNAAYVAAGGTFVNVTRATGGYDSLKQKTTLQPFGSIPVPVAKVCELSWFCDLHDIHPRPAGHKLIAHMIVATLPEH